MKSNNGSSVPSNTGTSGGSAGNNQTEGAVAPVPVPIIPVPVPTPPSTGPAPTGASVVAAKGFRLQLEQMLLGWQAVIPSGGSLATQSGSLTQAGVVSKLQTYLAVYTTLDTQATAMKATQAQEKQQVSPAQAYFKTLKEALVGFFGSSSPQLAQFGLKPRKAAKKLTSQQSAVRTAKAVVTRELRGTRGKNQKAGIVSGPMTVSVTPTAPASTVQPVAAPGPVATPAPAVGTPVVSPPGNSAK